MITYKCNEECGKCTCLALAEDSAYENYADMIKEETGKTLTWSELCDHSEEIELMARRYVVEGDSSPCTHCSYDH